MENISQWYVYHDKITSVRSNCKNFFNQESNKMKSRQIKKRNISVDDVEYIYSVTEYTDDVQIRVYKNKARILSFHLSYPESWGIDVFRPKTIELLIRYYNEKYAHY